MKPKLPKTVWLLVIFAFLLLISVWATFLTLALKRQPAVIPLEETHR